MQAHELKPTTKNTKAKVIGRGGKRGKTSGKGHKGQKARAGNSTRLEVRDRIKKIPKLRGRGVNVNKSVQTRGQAVNLTDLETLFTAGSKVTPIKLLEKGLIRRVSGKIPVVKILGTGDLTKKIDIADCLVSKIAAEKIAQAGGTVA
ncbi:MAG: uL15 family ribosomal protein [Candidatus Paceibacterota bacterium]